MAISPLKRYAVKTSGGEPLAVLADRLDDQADKNPQLRPAANVFAALAEQDITSNGGKMARLGQQLAQHPEYAALIEAKFNTDPNGFKALMPKLFNTPENAKTLLESSHAAPGPTAAANAPVAPPADPNKPSPIAAAAGAVVGAAIPSAHAETGHAAAAKRQVDRAVEATAGTAISAAANPSPDTQMAAKLAKLEAVPGFSDLLDRFDKNPALSDLKKRLMAGGGKGTDTMLDTVLDEAKKDPDTFKKWTKTIDEQPGAVSSIASTFSNSPETALMGIGMLSSFAQSDFGKTSIGKMLIGYVGKIMGMLQGSENLMQGASNNGTTLAAQALGASSGLQSMTLVNGSTTNVMTGKQFRDQAANQAPANGSAANVTAGKESRDQAANEPQYNVPKQAS